LTDSVKKDFEGVAAIQKATRWRNVESNGGAFCGKVEDVRV